ncbi:Nse4 [Necator americanus]|uniref:Non-structural maintenance of chromosomes element 4 n=1 Tax=Necator americanus TaxID=51031 RepID=W2T1R7_NECAM|nr:Nse4 [Necator americanus]ETN75940.1 Nse4 [Necator americanus]
MDVLEPRLFVPDTFMPRPLRDNNSNDDESDEEPSVREDGLTRAQLEEATRLNSQVGAVDPTEQFAKRASIREAYQDICSQFEGEQRTNANGNTDLIENLGKSFDNVDRSYRSVGAGGKELAADADTLLSMAKVLMTQMQSFQSSNAERTVTAAKFADALTLFLTSEPTTSAPIIDGEDNELLKEDDEEFDREHSPTTSISTQESQSRRSVVPKISLNQWAWLGRQDLGTLTYDVSFDYQSIRSIVVEDTAESCSMKPKKERAKRGKDEKEAAVVLTNKQNQGDDDEISVAKELDKVRKSLKRAWKDTPNVDFYSFVIDPTDFAKSVENMFYVSFLVKDGRVRLSVGEDGLPVLVHVSSEERERLHVDDRSAAETHQAIFSFNYEMWEAMVQVMDLNKSTSTQNQ